MWSVMLVDDDPAVVEGLGRHIDWTALDAQVVATARNGRDALALFEAHRPDIVVTDIYMPGMDGIALMQAIHAIAPATTCVVLSGYDEFEYARRSLQVGVVDYVLKPAPVGEITAVITRAVEHCRERSLRRRLEANLPHLREYFLLRLLRSEPDPEEARFLGLTHLLAGSFAVALLAVDRPGGLPEDEWQLARLQVRDAATGTGAYPLPYIGSELPVLLHNLATPEQWCTELLHDLQQHCALTVTIGLSRVGASIPAAYAEAQQALAYKEILGAGRLIRIDRVHVGSDSIPPYPVARNPRLLEALRFGDGGEVQRLVAETFANFQAAPLHYVRGACVELYGLGAIALSERGGTMDEVIPLCDFWAQLGAAASVAAIEHLVAQSLCAVAGRLNIRQKPRHSEALREIERLIATRYAEDLTLEEVAKAVFLSRTYVAYLFKQVRGCSFLEYLTQHRMQKARELLLQSSHSIYEVAEKVGYKNAAYFSRLFRDHFGLMPSDLRRGQGAV